MFQMNPGFVNTVSGFLNWRLQERQGVSEPLEILGHVEYMCIFVGKEIKIRVSKMLETPKEARRHCLIN